MIINKIEKFKKFLSSSYEKDYNIIFIYGSNYNLTNKYSNIYIKYKNFNIKNPFSTIYINSDDINNNPGILYNEIYTYNIFYENKLIWIRNANIKKKFEIILKKLSLSNIKNVSLLIETINIKNKDPIIQILSKSKNTVVIPCYSEEIKQINYTIDKILLDFNINMSKEAKNFLLYIFQSTKIPINNELEKICLYMMNNRSIKKNDILRIIDKKFFLTKYDIFKVILLGKINNFLQYFELYYSKFNSIFEILSIIQNIFYKILKIRLLIEDNNYTKNQVIIEIKNEFFFDIQNIIEKLVYIWSSNKIFCIIDKIQKSILNIRKYTIIKLYIIKKILLEITIESNKLIINYYKDN